MSLQDLGGVAFQKMLHFTGSIMKLIFTIDWLLDFNEILDWLLDFNEGVINAQSNMFTWEINPIEHGDTYFWTNMPRISL